MFNTVLLGTTRVSLPNSTSFYPTALAERRCVIDNIHTDGQTDRLRYGNVLQCRLIIIIIITTTTTTTTTTTIMVIIVIIMAIL